MNQKVLDRVDFSRVFHVLILILIVGAASNDYIALLPKTILVILFIISFGVLLKKFFDKHELRKWGLATWGLTKKIFPILLIGVFIVGIIGGIAAFFVPNADPSTSVGVAVAPYIGGNDIISCFLASVIGAILYMSTLLEVAIVGNLFGYSTGLMGGGPALALLLAGPSSSLPNMIVITRVMGTKKALVYFALVIIIATIVGFIFGNIMG